MKPIPEELTCHPSPKTIEALERIVTRDGITLAQAIEQALLNEDFLENQTALGGRLLLEKNGEVRKIVREASF